MSDDLKQAAAAAIERHRAELVALSQRIHDHPELGFNETQSAAWLVEACEKLGWTVRQGICELPTAWEASTPDGRHGPTVAFLAEYDALPEIGHACGHNLMAVAPLGALIGVQAVQDRLQGRAKVLGTPAEEGGGGKVLMAERGALSGVDVAMMVHPSSFTSAEAAALACEQFEVEFHGRPAHASSAPDKGINALNALILSFNHIDALRQHVRPTARIHGIIKHGGDAPNVVPDYSKGQFMVRAAENEYLEELMVKVKNCFAAGALATGCTYELKPVAPRYETVLNNPTLVELYLKAMDSLDVQCSREALRSIGSTDMGNVSWLVPAIHPSIAIVDGIANHTREFAAAAASDRAYQAMLDAAKAMAFTAIDLLHQPELIEQAKREFRSERNSSARQS